MESSCLILERPARQGYASSNENQNEIFLILSFSSSTPRSVPRFKERNGQATGTLLPKNSCAMRTHGRSQPVTRLCEAAATRRCRELNVTLKVDVVIRLSTSYIGHEKDRLKRSREAQTKSGYVRHFLLSVLTAICAREYTRPFLARQVWGKVAKKVDKMCITYLHKPRRTAGFVQQNMA